MRAPEHGQSGESRPHSQFRVFGGLRAARDGAEVDLGPWRQQVILAMLLVAAGGVVSIESMVDCLWGENPPASAINQIQRHVGQLRRILEPDLPARSNGRYLLPAGTGYRFLIATEDCDLAMFRELVRRARADVASGNTTAGVRAYLTAFELGRSPAFAGLPVQTLNTAGFVAVERERITVAVAATDAAILSGMADRALTPLLIMAEAAPLDEALQASLMRAHLATGNRAEAQRVFEQTRRRLVEELGVEPGPRLRDAYRELLASGWTPEDEQAPANVLRPAQLPPPVAGFVRRNDVAAILDERLADTFSETTVVITALGGMGGIGKTALAVHWAHEIADKFPDGQLYLNLRGFDPTGRVMSSDDALSTLLASLGEQDTPEQSLDVRAARYRTVLAGRRMLILLDNARDAEQVRPLLPATRGSLVIVTSRNSMVSLVAREGARYVQLDRLNEAESHEFLVNRLGRARTDAEADAVRDIVTACAGLPLALAIVAARAALNPRLPLRVIATQLATPSGALDTLSTVERGDDLRTVFSWSYHNLEPDAAYIFRVLAAHPGQEISLESVASAAGIDRTNTRLRLDALVASNLLVESRPGRFSVHDFLRAYGGEVLNRAGEREAVERRLVVHYLHSVHACYARYWRQPVTVLPAPGPNVWAETCQSLQEALDWYTREQPAVWPIAEVALRHGMVREAALLVLGVVPGLDRPPHAPETNVTIAQRILDAAPGIVEPVVEAELERCVAMMSPVPDAVTHMQRALSIFARIGDLAGQSNVSRNLAMRNMAQGDAACLAHAERAVELARQAGRRDLLASGLLTLSEIHLKFERTELGRRAGEEGLAIVRADRLNHLNIYYARYVAEASWKLGRLDQAIEVAEWGLAEAVSESNGPLCATAAILARAAFDRGDMVRAEQASQRFEALIAGDGFHELVEMSSVEEAVGYRDMVAYVRARLNLLETPP
ncbi:AfsR/SARP family transcriptional regulator [Dactylosporangium darangshiense]|uniref:AfsR/SARP family transcriptional regulator n=1 Tax=Dactylosporangium darangshiense TaxID=579108 RepID=UPI0031E6887F